MQEITVKTKLPLTSGKEATLTLQGDEVEITMPVSFRRPTVRLVDLAEATAELRDAQERVAG